MSVHPEQLLCPILVGREDEVATLRLALDRAVQGRVRGLFIRAEAGLGKSRLCRALIRDAQLRGCHPVVGLCSPQDTTLPYGPIVDALRRSLARIGPDVATRQPSLQNALPLLSQLLPELAESPPAASAAGGVLTDTPSALRRRLFAALLQAMRTISSHQPEGASVPAPLVLVLEDLHWADESTLEWVDFLLRSHSDLDDPVPDRGMLIVGTVRSEALSSAPALAHLLAAILSLRNAREIELRPLTPPQIEQMLEATVGRHLSRGVVEAFLERSEGNPFVVEELLGAVAAAGHLDSTSNGSEVATLHLPLSLRGAVLERLDLLPEEARSLLSAAAVVGRVFDLDVLAQVTNLDERTLLRALRLALRGSLVEENPAEGGSASATTGDRYRFRHALTHEVIYGELLGPERRALHRSVARVLEERLSGDPGTDGEVVETLAYHYRLAGDKSSALTYARRAAERDRALLAFAEARRHYAEALSYLPETDPERLPLLESLGLLSLALLDLGGAVGYIDAAITLLRNLGMARKAGAALGEMHHLLWYTDLARFQAMVPELDAVAEAAYTGADGAGPEDADALACYAAAALAHSVYANYTRAALWARRALELDARINPGATNGISPAAYKALLARAHARVHGHVGDASLSGAGESEIVEAGIRDLRDTLDLGLRLALPEVVQLTYNFLPRGLLEVGRDAEAVALIDAADEYARRSGVAAIADTRGFCMYFAGRWQEAIEIMRASVAFSRRIGAFPKLALELTALGHLLVATGHGTEAVDVLHEALAILEPSRQFVTLAPCLCGMAKARALLGQHEAAARLFQQGHTLWESTEDRGTVILLLLEGTLFYAAQGDVARAASWANDLARVAGEAPMPVAAAAAAHARGVALAAGGNHQEAQDLLRAAIARWEALARPYEAARARAALGAAIIAAAPRDPAKRSEADSALAAAEQTFARLGATPDAERTEDLRRRAGLLAQARRRQSLAQGRAPFGDLTPREREVLSLLAEGSTNREIAQKLFIAEGTAELHVSRILGKLGCATRAQAVAYAVANKLI